MDSNQFLSFFGGLSNEHTNEEIVNAAEGIINLVETKQKFENEGLKSNSEKFKLYLSLCEKPTEDLLYTAKRLIGGIASTGLEFRRGFLLTFCLFIQKFSNILNFNELIQIIEKETIVSKGEKGHIKNCVLTGKILMLKSVLELKFISTDNMSAIAKSLLELISSSRNLEEPILQVLNVFISRLVEGHYSELQEQKRVSKFFDKFINLFNKILVNKTNFGNLKNLYEFSMLFLLLSYGDENSKISRNVKDYFHTNTIQNIISDNSLLNYFKLLLAHNLKEGDFHISFSFMKQFLSTLDSKTVFSIWNILIDPEIQGQLKTVSLKNLQFLIYSFSSFLLEKFFVLDYCVQIFDSSFFDTLIKFNSNKKFKFISSLVEILMKKLKAVEEKESLVSYAYDLLQLFNKESGLSSQSYKAFYSFLFNLLDENMKLDYIQSLTGQNENDDLMHRVTALKQLMIGESEMSKSLKDKILEFFFKEFYSTEQRGDVEFEGLIEDRLLLIIFSYLRIPKEEVSENQTANFKPLKDKKIIKLFIQIHKYLQNLFTTKTIEDFEMDDYKMYLKFYKKFALLMSNAIKNTNHTDEDKQEKEKLFSVIKISLIVLILFLKNPNEYADLISDLYDVTQFKQDWQKVYIDILISLLHKGNNTFADFILNSFRRISKYLDKESFEVLISFLSQSSEKKEFEDDVDEISEKNPKKIKGMKKANGSTKMFEDLQNDVEMA